MEDHIHQHPTRDNSFWIQPLKDGPYTRTSRPLETSDVHVLVEALLAEFEQTSESDKEELRPKLESWLREMSKKGIDLSEQQVVRDFIYEMF